MKILSPQQTIDMLGKEKTLSEIKQDLERTAGEWNGDESGLKEERADLASEGIASIKNLESILEELNY